MLINPTAPTFNAQRFVKYIPSIASEVLHRSCCRHQLLLLTHQCNAMNYDLVIYGNLAVWQFLLKSIFNME